MRSLRGGRVQVRVQGPAGGGRQQPGDSLWHQKLHRWAMKVQLTLWSWHFHSLSVQFWPSQGSRVTVRWYGGPVEARHRNGHRMLDTCSTRVATQLWLRVPAGSKRVNRPDTCHVWSRVRSWGYLRRFSLWIILLEVRGWEANIPGFWLLDTLLGAGAGVTLSQCLLRNSSLSSLIRWLSTRSLPWRTSVQCVR